MPVSQPGYPALREAVQGVNSFRPALRVSPRPLPPVVFNWVPAFLLGLINLPTPQVPVVPTYTPVPTGVPGPLSPSAHHFMRRRVRAIRGGIPGVPVILHMFVQTPTATSVVEPVVHIPQASTTGPSLSEMLVSHNTTSLPLPTVSFEKVYTPSQPEEGGDV
jgi:hypothetical protein